jgi:hypothetical protein
MPTPTVETRLDGRSRSIRSTIVELPAANACRSSVPSFGSLRVGVTAERASYAGDGCSRTTVAITASRAKRPAFWEV